MNAQRAEGQRALDELAEEFVGLPGVDRKRMFGSEALRVRGKVFAFVGSEGELIVKVPADEAARVVERGGGERVRIGRNPAREWIGVRARDEWPALTRRAFEYVGSLG